MVNRWPESVAWARKDRQMRVLIAGSGDAFGSGGRFQTCIALADDGQTPARTLIDCGATSLTALRQQRVDPTEITTIVVTHLHGDHFGGLPFLILDGQFRRRTHDLTILGPPGTGERLTRTMEALFPGSSSVRRRFAVKVAEHTDRHPVKVRDLTITPYEVRHASGAPAYAIRAQGPTATLTYSGDTEWADTLLDAADGADLFICEGYSPQHVKWHLDLDTLAQHRDQLGCRRLLLTHLSPSALAGALTGWDIAHDGLCLDLP
jgi:ribonuclease BN (tRNA processing enzyme)